MTQYQWNTKSNLIHCAISTSQILITKTKFHQTIVVSVSTNNSKESGGNQNNNRKENYRSRNNYTYLNHNKPINGNIKTHKLFKKKKPKERFLKD